MAERLGTGLQNLLLRFKSGSDLKRAPKQGAFFIPTPCHKQEHPSSIYTPPPYPSGLALYQLAIQTQQPNNRTEPPIHSPRQKQPLHPILRQSDYRTEKRPSVQNHFSWWSHLQSLSHSINRTPAPIKKAYKLVAEINPTVLTLTPPRYFPKYPRVWYH